MKKLLIIVIGIPVVLILAMAASVAPPLEVGGMEMMVWPR